MINKQKLKLIKEILYGNKILSLNKIKDLIDKEILHIVAIKYNWDNGFEIPTQIYKNENCDLSTAILLFYLADGYRFLENKTNLNRFENTEWKNFLDELYNKIISNSFKTYEISYTLPISKVQAFKLFKQNLEIPMCFFEIKKGIELIIPNI